MNIFILIILCFYTIGGMFKAINGVNEDEPLIALGGIIKLILGIIAIVFHCITNL